MTKPKNRTKRSAQPDDLNHLLKHALPPEARAPGFARTLSSNARADLVRLGVTDAQTTRLARILPAIAYYTHSGPSLTAARKPLDDFEGAIEAAEKCMKSLLTAPAHDEAKVESRGRFLQSLERLFPDRCPPIQRHFGEPTPDDGLPEAQRLFSGLQDLHAATLDALKSMPRKQTRPVAHWYPVALIHAALDADAVSGFDPSASANSPFRQVVGICYQAAQASNQDPLRAIRAFVRNGVPASDGAP